MFRHFYIQEYLFLSFLWLCSPLHARKKEINILSLLYKNFGDINSNSFLHLLLNYISGVFCNAVIYLNEETVFHWGIDCERKCDVAKWDRCNSLKNIK